LAWRHDLSSRENFDLLYPTHRAEDLAPDPAFLAAKDCTTFVVDEACGCCDRRCLKDGLPGKIVCMKDCLDCKSAEIAADQ